MAKRLLVLTLAALLVTAAAYAHGAGTISGTAKDAQDNVLSGVRVQLRNATTGQLVGTTTSASNGFFSFTGLDAGEYVVEIVDSAGRLIGLSTVLSLATGGVIEGVMVAASAAGALSGAAATAGGLGAFFTTTGGILVLVGVGAGITAGVIAATGDASGSR